MSDERNMSYDKMNDHAFANAVEYLRLAIHHVDKLKATDGGAKNHPELVAALVQAAATEYNSLMLSHLVCPLLEQLESAAADVGDSARKIRRTLGK